MSKLLEDLKYRDLVYQQTDEEGINQSLEWRVFTLFLLKGDFIWKQLRKNRTI